MLIISIFGACYIFHTQHTDKHIHQSNKHMTSLPNELVDNILSYCPGHVRADLRQFHISVKLNNANFQTRIANKLELEECPIYNYLGNEDIRFINQKNNGSQVGYVSKQIQDDYISYTWIKIVFV